MNLGEKWACDVSAKCRSCIYRSKIDKHYLCDYIGATNHRRPCKINGCTVYKRGAAIAKELESKPEVIPSRFKLEDQRADYSPYNLNVTKAKALYDQGISDVQIAIKLGVSQQTVQYWRVRCNLRANNPLKERSKLRIDEVLRLYGEGVSCKEIADRVGLSFRYVENVLRDNGIDRRKVVRVQGRKVGTEEWLTFDNMHEAERETGIFRQNIRACLIGKQDQTKGWEWRTDNDSI